MNKAKPEVKITLDKERTLKLTLNSMVAFEEATGKSLLNGSFNPAKMTAKELRAMLWACLLDDDQTLKAEDVGKMITSDNMVEISQKLNETFEVALPGKSENPLPEKPPTG